MNRVFKLIGLVFSLVGAIFTVVGAVLALAIGLSEMWLFSLFGIFFLAMGIGFTMWTRHARRERIRLLEEGVCINADIFEVGYDTRVRYNGRCPLVIRCQAMNLENGRVYVFQSESFWFDPSPFLTDISALPVYVQMNNWRHYTVDTSNIVPEHA